MPLNEAERRALEGLAGEQRGLRGMLGRTYRATGTARDPRGEVEAMGGDEARYFKTQMDRLRQNYAMARMRQKWQKSQMDQAIREQKRRRKAATRGAVLGGLSAITGLYGRGSGGGDPQVRRQAPAQRDVYSQLMGYQAPRGGAVPMNYGSLGM